MIKVSWGKAWSERAARHQNCVVMSATTGFAGLPPHTGGLSRYMAASHPTASQLTQPFKGQHTELLQNQHTERAEKSFISFVYTCNKSQDPERPPHQRPKWNLKWRQIHFHIFFFPQFIFFGLHLTHCMRKSLSLNRNHSESAAPIVCHH